MSNIPRPDPVYRPFDPALPNVVIFDMDGTLSLLGGRNPYDASRCDRDPVHTPVLMVADTLSLNYPIIVVSARYEKVRPQTKIWLEHVGLRYLELLMRKDGDNRGDALVKAEIYRDDIAPRFNVQCVFDDRSRVVAMWRWFGVPCFQVAEGDF